MSKIVIPLNKEKAHMTTSAIFLLLSTGLVLIGLTITSREFSRIRREMQPVPVERVSAQRVAATDESGYEFSSSMGRRS